MSAYSVKRPPGGKWLFSLIIGMHLLQRALHADQIVYDNALENGWQNWGWATLNYTNAAPVHGGSNSISVTMGGWAGIQLSPSTWIPPRMRASVSG